MDVSAFDFELPEACIATRPARPRDSAKLLVVGAQLQDRVVRDLPDLLQPGDVLVVNDTRVIPARLMGKRGETQVEVLLHKPHGDHWQCFARPAKKLRVGDYITFASDFQAKVLEKLSSGEVVLQFNQGRDALLRYGQMPLPPYMKRSADAQDHTDYQTLFARNEGSVAAPTAGLHFTPELMMILEARGIKRAHVTLHVGAGTFQPVKVADTRDHVMHSEYAEVTAETAKLINETRAHGGRVVAVGTTSLRTLESAADETGSIHPFAGETAIFITPGYRFKIVDLLLTNFHLPKSTLFMLVSAFSGLERMKTAYAHAIVHNYRFYSYGDACLLDRIIQ